MVGEKVNRKIEKCRLTHHSRSTSVCPLLTTTLCTTSRSSVRVAWLRIGRMEQEGSWLGWSGIGVRKLLHGVGQAGFKVQRRMALAKIEDGAWRVGH